MILYSYWRSSCSWRVRWALYHKGLDFEIRPVNLLTGEGQKELKSRFPFATLPCLVVGDEVIGESMAILEWLEDAYPQKPLLPQDPLTRAFARQLALGIISQVQPLQNLSVLKAVKAQGGSPEEWARQWIHRGLLAYEKTLEQKSSMGTYSLGSQLTIADLCLIPQCYNARRFGVDLSEMPQILKIEDHCLKLESCQKAYPKELI